MPGDVVVLPVVLVTRIDPAAEPVGVPVPVTDINAWRHRQQRTAEEKAALASPFDGIGK